MNRPFPPQTLLEVFRDRRLVIFCKGGSSLNEYKNPEVIGTPATSGLKASTPPSLHRHMDLTPGLSLIILCFPGFCLLKRVVTKAFSQAGQKSL